MSGILETCLRAAIDSHGASIGQAEATRIYNDAVANGISLTIALCDEDKRYVTQNTTITPNFRDTHHVGTDHGALMACRQIIRTYFQKDCKWNKLRMPTLVIGATMRDIEDFIINPCVRYYAPLFETKDYERVILPALNAIVNKNNKSIREHNRTDLVDVELRRRKNGKIFKLAKNISATHYHHPDLYIRKVEHAQALLEEFTATHNMTEGAIVTDLNGVKADVLLFQDSMYNYDEDSLHKLFVNTGANIAYGYMCLPFELLFTESDCGSGQYKYWVEGDRSYMTYAKGSSNGYDHLTRQWSTLFRVPGFRAYHDNRLYQYTFEIRNRSGPMVNYVILRSPMAQSIIRSITLPEHFQYVYVMDILESREKEWGDGLDLPEIVRKCTYFKVRASEWFATVNYCAGLPEASLSRENIMNYVRRQSGQLIVATGANANKWDIESKYIHSLALAIVVHVTQRNRTTNLVIGRADWDRKQDRLLSRMKEWFLDKSGISFIMRFFQRDKLWETIVRDPQGFSIDQKLHKNEMSMYCPMKTQQSYLNTESHVANCNPAVMSQMEFEDYGFTIRNDVKLVRETEDAKRDAYMTDVAEPEIDVHSPGVIIDDYVDAEDRQPDVVEPVEELEPATVITDDVPVPSAPPADEEIPEGKQEAEIPGDENSCGVDCRKHAADAAKYSDYVFPNDEELVEKVVSRFPEKFRQNAALVAFDLRGNTVGNPKFEYVELCDYQVLAKRKWAIYKTLIGGKSGRRILDYGAMNTYVRDLAVGFTYHTFDLVGSSHNYHDPTDIPDAHYDVVILNMVLHHTYCPASVIWNVLRVLAPQGVVHIFEHYPDNENTELLWATHAIYDHNDNYHGLYMGDLIDKRRLSELLTVHDAEIVEERIYKKKDAHYIVRRRGVSQEISQGECKMRDLLDDLNLNVTDMEVLDVGTASGGFAKEFLRRGALRVVGVDTNATSAMTADRYEFVHKSIEEYLKTCRYSFDVMAVDLYNFKELHENDPSMFGKFTKVGIFLLKHTMIAEIRAVAATNEFVGLLVSEVTEIFSERFPGCAISHHASHSGRNESWIVVRRVEVDKPFVLANISSLIVDDSSTEPRIMKEVPGALPMIVSAGFAPEVVSPKTVVSNLTTHDCFVCTKLMETARQFDDEHRFDGVRHVGFAGTTDLAVYYMSETEVKSFRQRLTESSDMATAGLRDVLLKASENTHSAEIMRKIPTYYIRGPPGCGKSFAIRSLFRAGDLVLMPFSKLRPEYSESLTCPPIKIGSASKTQHRAIEKGGAWKTVYIDEFTAYPFELLMMFLQNNTVDRIVLVGDTAQTKVRHDSNEGTYIGDRIPIDLLPRHECFHNYRNGEDVCLLMNSMFGYDMVCKTGRRKTIFYQPSSDNSCSEAANLEGHTLMSFSKNSAGLLFESQYADRKEAEIHTVRHYQGSTENKVSLAMCGVDSRMAVNRRLLIVALTRHKERLVITYSSNDKQISTLISQLQHYTTMVDIITTATSNLQDGRKMVTLTMPETVVEKAPHPMYDAFRSWEILLEKANIPVAAWEEPANVRSVAMPRAGQTIINEGLQNYTNNRGNVIDYASEMEYRIMASGFGLTYNSKDKYQESATIVSRYARNMKNKSENADSIAWARGVVKSYFRYAKGDSKTFERNAAAVLNEDNLNMLKDKMLEDATTKHYWSRFDQEVTGGIWNTVLFSLKNAFKPNNSSKTANMESFLGKISRPGQGISAWPVGWQVMFCLFFRVYTFLDAATDLRDLKKDRRCVVNDNGMNEGDFLSYLKAGFKNLPPFCTAALSDAEFYDITQDKQSQRLEREYLSMLGAPEWFIDIYFQYRNHKESKSTWLTVFPNGKKDSGAPCTLFGNTVVCKTILYYICDISSGSVVVSSSKGDDAINIATGISVNENNLRLVQENTSLNFSVNTVTRGEYCGYYFHRDENTGYFDINPNLLRMLVKICGKGFRDISEWRSYQIALRDRLEVIAAVGDETVIDANAIATGFDRQYFRAVYDCIRSFTHINEEQFYEVFRHSRVNYYYPTAVTDGSKEPAVAVL